MLLCGNQTAIPYCKILQVTFICHCISGHCSCLSFFICLHNIFTPLQPIKQYKDKIADICQATLPFPIFQLQEKSSLKVNPFSSICLRPLFHSALKCTQSLKGKKHVSKTSLPLNFQIEFNLSAKMHHRITACNLNQVSNSMLLSHGMVPLTSLGTLKTDLCRNLFQP